KKTLRIAAKYARGTSFMGAASYVSYTNFAGILDVFRRKSDVLAAHCRDLGTDFDSITRSANFNVIVGATEADVDDRLSRLADLYSRFATASRAENSLQAFRESPAVGTTEQVIEALSALQDAGMTYAICYFPHVAHDKSNLELFEREVIPGLS
ncbi:MAG TPA: hypothetical protein VIQ02_19765, partial [Jiangellaceae bacterium]